MLEIVETLDEAKEAAHNDAVCRYIGQAIMKAYPGRRWLVEVMDKGFVCYIKMPGISMEYGVCVLLKKHQSNDCKRCVLAAGELLERFMLTRGRTDNIDLFNLPSNHKGVIGADKGEL